MAASVLAPAMPSAMSPLDFWKSITAFLVCEPKLPVWFPEKKPRAASICWSFLTSVPLDPSVRTAAVPREDETVVLEELVVTLVVLELVPLLESLVWMAARVFAPATPSAERPLERWKL